MDTNFLIGLILSVLMGLGGYYKKALSKSGGVGAVLIGTVIFGFGGWVWGGLLIIFFVSSSILSFFKVTQKAGVAEKFDKGHRRDIGQVLANGGVGALIAIASVIWPVTWWWYAFLGAIGTVNADTWATELGVLSKKDPYLITTGETVPVGTSGGVTVMGTLAALGGASLIGGVALLFVLIDGTTANTVNFSPFLFIVVAALGGLIGALFDSWLGATWQAMYYCDTCAKETEQTHHWVCNTPARPLKGLSWLNNDLVNFISAIFGAVGAVGIGLVLEALFK